MEIIDKYYAFSLEQHAKGCHTAISYVKALKIVDEVFLKNNLFLEQEHSIWFVNDVKRLTELYKFVKSEQKKHDGGVFRNVLSKSYWKGGFCSAAIMEFSQFLTLSARQDEMLEKFENTNDSLKLSTDLQNIKIEPNQLLIPDDISIDSLEGRTKLREVEIRQNQDVFRKMILSIYGGKCCLTGLDVPEVLIASHISSWSNDKKNRMNPSNGLCLSATYDAAFDKYLISFDDDYRMVLSNYINDFCTKEVCSEYFKKFEGVQLALPSRFLPDKKLLEKHRKILCRYDFFI